METLPRRNVVGLNGRPSEYNFKSMILAFLIVSIFDLNCSQLKRFVLQYRTETLQTYKMGKPEYKTTNLNSRVDAINSHWTPELVTTFNNSHSMKIATIKGDFIWHSHPETDEVFYCVSGGPFKIELNTTASSPEEAEKVGMDDVVELKVGDVFCVPRGMQHRPRAQVEAGILMIEKVGTVNTGERTDSGRTVLVDEGSVVSGGS